MIQTEHLSKRFGDFQALRDVTCVIPKGCIYGMVGSNGAGKSTFLRLITGIYRTDSGTVTLDGEPVYENPAVKQHIAFIPDELFFLPGANLQRMCTLYQTLFPAFDTKRFHFLTNAFRLSGTKALNTFSKGMRRQAATVLALSCRPDYLFFDETFDGLDPVMRNLVKELICQDVVEREVTAIITSHSLRELEDTCDQLALLHEGGVVLQSDVQDLKTSLFKVQIAFPHDYDRSLFTPLNLLSFRKTGSVATLIVRGDKEATVQQLFALAPSVLDVLPLTLEEVFTFEMEALGYSFKNVFGEEAPV